MKIYNGEIIEDLEQSYFEKIFIIVNKDKRSIDEINHDPDLKVLDIDFLEITFSDINKLPICSIFKGRHNGIDELYTIIKVESEKCVYRTQLMPPEQILGRVYAKINNQWNLIASNISIDELDKELLSNSIEEKTFLKFEDENGNPITKLILGIEDTNGIFYVDDIDEDGYSIDSIDNFIEEYQEQDEFLDKIMQLDEVEIEEVEEE